MKEASDHIGKKLVVVLLPDVFMVGLRWRCGDPMMTIAPPKADQQPQESEPLLYPSHHKHLLIVMSLTLRFRSTDA